MDFPIIIFKQLCRYNKEMEFLFKILFDTSHRYRDIPEKKVNSAFFSMVDFTL